MFNIKNLLLTASCLLLGSPAFGEHEIYSVKRGDFDWILPKPAANTFSITPVDAIDHGKCAKINAALGNADSVIAHCRVNVDDPKCDKEAARKIGRTLAFGEQFDASGDVNDIDPAAVRKWRVVGLGSNQLDPKLLEEYARHLGLVPLRSVVAVPTSQSLRLSKVEGKDRVFFRPTESKEHAGFSYSWLFQDQLGMLPASQKAIYIDQPNANEPTFLVRSHILNCELAKGGSNYLDVAMEREFAGNRALPEMTVYLAYDLYEAMLTIKFPEKMSKANRTLLYGFNMGRWYDGQMLYDIGFEVLMNRLFTEVDGQITPRKYASKQEFTNALNALGTFTKAYDITRLTKAP